MIELKNLYDSCGVSIEYNNNFDLSTPITYVYIVYNTDKPEIKLIGCFDKYSILPIDYKLDKDGYYTISAITLNDSQELDQKLTVLLNGVQTDIYSIDGELKYKDQNESLINIPEQSILSIIAENQNNTKYIQNIDYVSICLLKKCYIQLCQSILDKQIYSRCKINTQNMQDMIYQRDLIWMAINVITYLTEFCQLYEAQRIIEQLSVCNGICKNEYKITGGCGCS